MSDIYVVLNHGNVVGSSRKLQGAELLRADEATRLTDAVLSVVTGGAGIHHQSVR